MKTATLKLRKQEYEVKAGMTIYHALEKLGIDEQSVIATRDGEVLTDDEILLEGDAIKLVAVISGG
ncbi:MAG: MoaD/ThiS family protein [Anaerolineales bacterium]|nr:MoaD/ThiS family protein [Anaerolineales bacterium]MCK5313649.1 MoaD/ThiS family protein [Anaerolineales bacterium]